MPRIPIFKLGSQGELPPPRLTSYTPALNLEGLHLGIDNVRHDVWLSPQFCKGARRHIATLMARYGNVSDVLAAEPGAGGGNGRSGLAKFLPSSQKKGPDLKQLLVELHKSILNQAKAKNNPTLDLLGRTALLKFLRSELHSQFSAILDRCRSALKGYEGVRQQKALEYRETVARFQIAKKHILRQTGEELFRMLREIERETLSSMRRSLFGTTLQADYNVLLNQLIFHEDGRDSYLQAENYVLIGGFDNDLDSIGNIRALACEFFKTVATQALEADASWFDGWLSAPENAQELVGSGEPDDQVQKQRLRLWMDLLEREELLDLVVATYEVIPLIKEFTPLLDPQQLKYSLVSRTERDRIAKLVEEHGKLSLDKITASADRVADANSGQKAKSAARYLRDFMLYYRDLRRNEVLNRAMEKIHVVANDRLCELSKVNGTLHSFLLAAEESSQGERAVVRHVIIKADVRDSSRVTRSLLERDMNPASYFSLNFYDPVNKLLEKYGATKVFVEGDAVILALLEKEGEPPMAVARACVLAREMLEIVGGYNHLLQRSGLPPLELGIGISYQDSAPMYLLDGEHRIMISDALNESDRLSSCDKRVRKALRGISVPFNAYEFRSHENPDADPMRYNVGGIRLSEAAHKRLKEEISLTPVQLDFPRLWGTEENSYFTALVPVAADVFRRIVLRAARVPTVELPSFNLAQWTGISMCEVCTAPAVYKAIEKTAGAGNSH